MADLVTDPSNDPRTRGLARGRATIRNLSKSRDKIGKLEHSFAMAVRHFLEAQQKKDAQNPEGKSRVIRILENMAKVAMSGGKLSVQAANLLLDRAYGKAKPSEEEADAIAKSGLKIVFMSRPELSETPRPALPPAVPDFVESGFEEGANGNG